MCIGPAERYAPLEGGIGPSILRSFGVFPSGNESEHATTALFFENQVVRTALSDVSARGESADAD